MAHCKQNISLAYIESSGPIMGKVGKVKKSGADIQRWWERWHNISDE